jgi:hypothetical protein
MRFAFADPPYLGCGSLYAKHHSEALAWDDPATHRDLFARLADEYADGWVMCCSSPSLQTLLPMAPAGSRVGGWFKTFASFKPNVNPAYAWEPIIFSGGRKRPRTEPTVRDWLACPITLRKGLTGAKPREFCRWVIQLLGAQRGDTFDDLFPGTGVFGEAWSEWQDDLIASPLPTPPNTTSISGDGA